MSDIQEQRLSENAEKLAAFATAVGTDIKDLQANKADKTALEAVQQAADTAKNELTAAINSAVETAKTALKAEILGGEVDSALDTIKELGDKLAEHKVQMDATKAALEIGDLLTAYTAAKQASGAAEAV